MRADGQRHMNLKHHLSDTKYQTRYVKSTFGVHTQVQLHQIRSRKRGTYIITPFRQEMTDTLERLWRPDNSVREAVAVTFSSKKATEPFGT